MFIGMVHNRSPSLCTTLGESSDVKGSLGSPTSRGCNVVTSTYPIIATPVPESTPALQTTPTVVVQTAAPQPGMELLPDQQQAYQEEQQA
jgi:hypothetical protein